MAVFFIDQDEEVLKQFCGGEIPQAVSDSYELLLHAHHKVGQGSIAEHAYAALLSTCLNAGAINLPVRQPSEWDAVEIGTDVSVYRPFTNELFVHGTFQGVVDEPPLQAGNVKVACRGDMNTIQQFSAELVEIKKASLPIPLVLPGDEEKDDESPGPVFSKYEGPWRDAPKGTPVHVVQSDGGTFSGKFVFARKKQKSEELSLKVQFTGPDGVPKAAFFDATMVTAATELVIA